MAEAAPAAAYLTKRAGLLHEVLASCSSPVLYVCRYTYFTTDTAPSLLMARQTSVYTSTNS